MIRDNWRLVLLVVVVLASTFALFSPTMAPDDPAAGDGSNAAEGLTNLQYGLELAGGTRIRAPLVGVTAEGVDFGGNSEAQVAADVADQLELADRTDVTVRQRTQSGGTVEVTSGNVTPAELGDALDAAGYEYETTRDGVTEATRQEAVDVIESKINEAGLSGGSVRQVQSAGEFFILVEVPGGQSRNEVIDLLQERGTVRIDILYPTGNGSYAREEAALTGDDFQNVGTAQQDDRLGPHVPVTVQAAAADRFQDTAVETGLAQQGGSQCTYNQEPVGETSDPCILLVVNDEVVNAFGMDRDLAASMRSGEWADDPNFVLTTTSLGDAQRIALNIRAGALPAKLDIGPDGSGTSSFISPTQGENFRLYSLVTGVVAVFAVAGMVFFRYRNPEVALPMILTALAEVYALLGFAAGLGYPLDLAVIAGFVAVIGTGVDDLVIIADEVMSEGDVNSRKVFDSRFRRAFWVIGAAAATTIIAMSPLAVLSLGDLRGFAIFTILGVLVGVLVTRPAYGDILRRLLTDR